MKGPVRLAPLAQGTRHSASGFGLLEVVISAGILAMVVGASVGLMNQSLKRAVLASERTTAMNLASEALEQVRMLRDSTYIDGKLNDWSAWTVTGDAVLGRPYHVDLAQRTLLPGSDSFVLNARTYVRQTVVTLPPPDQSYAKSAGLAGVADAAVIRKVTVTVTWGSGPGERVEAITYLTDWRSGV